MLRRSIAVGLTIVVLTANAALSDGPPTFVTKWGTQGTGDGQFNSPRGITVGSDGYIYVTEWGNHRVQKFTRDGQFVTKWGTQGAGDGQFSIPIGIATDAQGNVFVAEHFNHRVQKFTGDGTFITKWGSYGGTDGKFNKPTGVAVDGSGNVYVADYDGRRVQKFNGNGQWLTTWHGTEGGGPQYYRPWGLAVDPDGFIYVAEYGGNRVRKLASDGTLLTIWGSLGSGDGQFRAPTGISLDKVGNLYVADHENHRIQKFTSDGQFLAKWGTYGSGDGQFAWVSGVTVDSENYIYTAGYVNNRIDKYAYFTALKATMQVRAEHDDDPFVTPSPPLVGAKVVLHVGGYKWEGVTGLDGVVDFPVARDAGGYYEVQLTGANFHVQINRWMLDDSNPVVRNVSMDEADDITEFEWPNGIPLSGVQLDEAPSIQAVYFAERFRTDYWLGRMAYEWTLPTRLGRSPNVMGITINEVLADIPLQFKLGGAGVFYDDPGHRCGMRFSGHRCREADVVYHEYAHLVIADRLLASIPGQLALASPSVENDQGVAMDEALADYFAATYTNDPDIGQCGWFPGCTAVRRLTDRLIYPTNYRYDAHRGSLILSGALWELRGRIEEDAVFDARTTDALIFNALDKMISTKTQDPIFRFVDFYNALKEVDAAQGGQFSSQIDAAFEAYNIRHNPVQYTALAWEGDDGITAVNENSPDEIELVWSPVVGAVSYQVLANTVDYDEDLASLFANFVAVADSVIGTNYVFSPREARVKYIFTVVAVDSTGQPGYMALPVVVEAADATGVRDGAPPDVREWLGRFLFNSPNPFNPLTRVVFELKLADEVSMVIFNVSGQKIRQIAGKRFDVGQHHIEWDGRDQRGVPVASGQYFVMLKGTRWQDSGKVLLLK